jgi:hypothetical protein
MRTTAIGLVAVAAGCLAVAPPAQAQGRSPPAGSYAATCRDSHVSGGVLTAQCLDARGREHTTTLGYTTCRGDIANQNGALTCPGGAPAANPDEERGGAYYPQGSDIRRGPRDQGYPDRGYPDRAYPDRGSPDRGYPDRGYPDRGYPDRGYPDRGGYGR